MGNLKIAPAKIAQLRRRERIRSKSKTPTGRNVLPFQRKDAWCPLVWLGDKIMLEGNPRYSGVGTPNSALSSSF